MKELSPEPPGGDRGLTPALACKSLSRAVWHAACLLRINSVLPTAYHPFHWLIMGTRTDRWIAAGQRRANHAHWSCSLHWCDYNRSRWQMKQEFGCELYCVIPLKIMSKGYIGNTHVFTVRKDNTASGANKSSNLCLTCRKYKNVCWVILTKFAE